MNRAPGTCESKKLSNFGIISPQMSAHKTEEMWMRLADIITVNNLVVVLFYSSA